MSRWLNVDGAEAGANAVAVLEAMDDPEVREAYNDACARLSHYGAVMARAGVPGDQVASQVLMVALAVILEAAR